MKDNVNTHHSTIHWITQHRWPMFITALLCLSFLCLGLLQLKLTSDVRSMMDESHPALVAIDRMQKDFAVPRSFVIFLHQSENQLNFADLEIIDALSSRLESAPHVTSVRSLANSIFIKASGDHLDINYLYDRNIPERSSIKEQATARDWILKDPTLSKSFISDDGSMSAIVLNTSLDQRSSTQQQNETLSFIKAVCDEFSANNPKFRVDISGELTLDLTRNIILYQDIEQNITLSITLIFILLLILFRSFTAAISVFSVAICACLTALGFAGYCGLHLNNINLAAPIVVVVISTLGGIHVMSHFINQDSQLSTIRRLEQTIMMSLKPVSLTTITTATGFLALNFSSSPAIASLGNIASFGIVMGWFFTFALLPSIISVRNGSLPDNSLSWAKLSLQPFCWAALNHPKKVLGIFTLLTVFSVYHVRHLTIDDNPFDSLNGDLQIVKSQDFIRDQMHSGTFSIYIDTGVQAGIHNSDFLAKLDTFSEWLRNQHGVVGVYSYVDHIKRINQIMNNGEPEFYRTPNTDALAAQYGLLYQFSIPSPDEVSRYTDINEQKIPITVLTDELSRGAFNQLINTIESKLGALDLVEQAEPTGWLVIFNSEVMNWAQELIQGFIIGFLVISLQMLFYFRSLVFGVVSLVPNLLPIGITFGLWSVLRQSMDFTTLLVLSVSFGIVIDDTIHFMSKYLEGLTTLQDTDSALRHAFDNSGPAIIVTTIALAVGLSPMLLSDFIPLQSITKLIGPIALIALFTDLLLLPAILKIIGVPNGKISAFKA